MALNVNKDPALRFFKKGDVILGINGEKIADVVALQSLLADPPRRWTIEILRGQKKRVLQLR